MQTSTESPGFTAFLALLISFLLFYLTNTIRKIASRPSSAPTPEEKQKELEQATKPLKPMMQPPVVDLAPPKDDPFTPEELAQYDGSDPSKPIYVAIKGASFVEVRSRRRSLTQLLPGASSHR